MGIHQARQNGEFAGIDQFDAGGHGVVRFHSGNTAVADMDGSRRNARGQHHIFSTHYQIHHDRRNSSKRLPATLRR